MFLQNAGILPHYYTVYNPKECNLNLHHCEKLKSHSRNCLVCKGKQENCADFNKTVNQLQNFNTTITFFNCVLFDIICFK
jgi:hypothetical protein